MKFNHGDRVRLTIDLDELKKGSEGRVVCDNHGLGEAFGVQFDGSESISIGRRKIENDKNSYARVLDHCELIN